MTISGVSGGTGLQGVNNGMQQASGMNAASDPISRDIQRQIENQQKKLQDLASNDKLSSEEKMKKRQEIQQEITSLTQQLRQHQMELKREQQQAKNDMSGTGRTAQSKSDDNGSSLSQEGMQALLSAGASIKQAETQGSSASKLEGKANVLRSEIKTDAERGSSTEKKQQELAEVEGRAKAAAISQAYSLGNANDAIEDAAKAEKDNKNTDTAKADNEDNKKDKTGNAGNTDKTDVSTHKTKDADDAGREVMSSESDKLDVQAQTAALQQQTVYASVDIRL